MPRTKQANERLRAEQRSRILDAARSVFARKGIAATLDDIAAEAGVSHGLAYRYFPNKDAIYQELVIEGLRSTPHVFQRVLEMPGTPGERLAAMITGLVESRRRSQVYQLFSRMLSDGSSPPDLTELIRQRGQELQTILRQLIVEGQGTGEVAAGDPDQLVRALIAMLEGLTRWVDQYPDDPPSYFPDPQIILRMFKLDTLKGDAS